MEILGPILTVVVVLWLYVSARDWLAELQNDVREIRDSVLLLRKEVAELGAHLAEFNLASASEFQDLRARMADKILDRL